jgi:hypothetical protein
MDLPCGIAGFRHVNDPPLPICDFNAFRGHCYAAARTVGGHVASVEAPVPARNFAQALVELPTGRIAVLLNAHFPVIAFANTPPDGGQSLRFIDNPALAEAFQDVGT